LDRLSEHWGPKETFLRTGIDAYQFHIMDGAEVNVDWHLINYKKTSFKPELKNGGKPATLIV
jgi:hypothetical protein